jgi:hypothetical protein
LNYLSTISSILIFFGILLETYDLFWGGYHISSFFIVIVFLCWDLYIWWNIFLCEDMALGYWVIVQC